MPSFGMLVEQPVQLNREIDFVSFPLRWIPRLSCKVQVDLSPETVEFRQFMVPERFRATACAFGV